MAFGVKKWVLVKAEVGSQMTITPEQSTAARKLLCWSKEDLALLSGVSEKTIDRFEGRRRVPWAANVAAVRKAFEAAGIEFNGLSINLRTATAIRRAMQNPPPLRLPARPHSAFR